MLINTLLADGVTLDEIRARLEQEGHEDVSRSALGRYKINQDALSAELKRSRLIAETLVREADPSEADSQMARVGIEMLHGLLMKITAAELSGGQLDLDPREVHFLARAFKDLSSAQKTDADRIAKIRETALRQAADVVDTVAKKRGLTKETAADIRREVLGIGK